MITPESATGDRYISSYAIGGELNMKSTVRHFITVIVLVTLVLGALAIAPASFALHAATLYTSAGVFVLGRSTLNLPTELTI